MYKTIGQAIELANGLKRELFEINSEDLEVVICPPFTALVEVAEVIYDSNIQLGAQDMYWQEEGAFTGAVSPLMLKDAGCKFVIIGHSERRQYFAETNENVNKKIKAALQHGLTPIVCVGETLTEREKNKTFDVLDDHIKNGLKDLSDSEVAKIVIAYEPVWAIGTGKTATPGQAEEAQKYIRNLLLKLYNKDIADTLRIQYGGSIKPENIVDLMKQPDVDGGLVGGASLKLEAFADIVKGALSVKK